MDCIARDATNIYGPECSCSIIANLATLRPRFLTLRLSNRFYDPVRRAIDLLRVVGNEKRISLNSKLNTSGRSQLCCRRFTNTQRETCRAVTGEKLVLCLRGQALQGTGNYGEDSDSKGSCAEFRERGQATSRETRISKWAAQSLVGTRRWAIVMERMIVNHTSCTKCCNGGTRGDSTWPHTMDRHHSTSAICNPVNIQHAVFTCDGPGKSTLVRENWIGWASLLLELQSHADTERSSEVDESTTTLSLQFVTDCGQDVVDTTFLKDTRGVKVCNTVRGGSGGNG